MITLTEEELFIACQRIAPNKAIPYDNILPAICKPYFYEEMATELNEDLNTDNYDHEDVIEWAKILNSSIIKKLI